MNAWTLSIVIAILAVISLCSLSYIFYLKYVARPTREKFAFYAVGAIISLSIFGITSAFYQTPWVAIGKILEHFMGTDFGVASQTTPTFPEQSLIIILSAFAIKTISGFFTHWQGQQLSVNQYEQQKRHDDVSLLLEGWNELERRCKRLPEPEIYNPVDYRKLNTALDTPQESLAWRDQALELITLRWHGYYRFDSNNDWHEKAHCWIGNNIKENKKTAIFCCRVNPTEQDIEGFVDYIESLGFIIDQCEYLVIVQHGTDKITHQLHNITIEQYSESHLLDELVDFEDYFLDLKRRTEFEYLPDSNLVVSDIYVPSALKNESGEDINENLEEYLNNWLCEAGQRQLALLGEYGQGKSTGTLMFSHKLIQKYYGKSQRIPILIELRGKSPKTLQPNELLSVWASNYRIDPKALMKLQQSGRLLLIFEGFDEMAEVYDAEARLSHFETLWQFCYPKAKILITGRPNFFLDDQELKALLGIDRSTATGAYAYALHLKPFSIEKIESSLRNINHETCAEIVKLAKTDTKFYDIVSRPSLLYIVNQLWNTEELKNSKHEMNSALVIDLFIQHSYKRQTEKSRDGKQFMVLTQSEREYFMDGIAAFMIKEKLPNQILFDKFDVIVEKLYQAIPDDVSFQTNAMNNIQNKPLKFRLKDHEDALDAVKTDVRTCGVLVKDLTRSNAWKFPHKSFLEYLFANYAVKRLIDKNNSGAAAIWSVTKAEPIELLTVIESLEFAGELLSQTDGIKEVISNKDALQRKAHNIIVNQSFNIISQKLAIITALLDNTNEAMLRRMIRRFGINKVFLLLVVILFLLPGSLLISAVYNLQLSIDMSVIFKKTNFLIIGIFALAFFILIRVFRSKNIRETIQLWFFLIMVLGISYKDVKKRYGKFIADTLPSLSKNTNAEHLLNKYSYFQTDE